VERVESPLPPVTRGPSAGEAERFYREYRRLLLYVAARKFRVPDADAEALLQEAMVAFLTTHTRVESPKAWLVATMCNLSRRYWRDRIRDGDVEGGARPDAAEGTPDCNLERIECDLLVQRVLSLLQTGDREVLHLRYFEQLTGRAIAERLGTTLGYAEKRVRVALGRAREIYVRLHPAGTPGRAPRGKGHQDGARRRSMEIM
jgi:RNA polymerase sigma factor (sigma-70 family)